MEVTEPVWRIVRELHRAGQLQRRAAARSPLGPVALGLLNLAAQAPVRPSSAAAELDVPAQSITRAMGTLLAAGLVHRVGDTEDGRSYAIEVTEQGRAARDRFRAELTAQFTRHLDGWTAGEITDFAAKLHHLVSALANDTSAATTTTTSRNPWRT
ncbi:MAG TPA: MarR family winged helix-turn-helix transcriptional regulator [Pseudonocardia sp.]|uniref:MarR family winged helix-turn-helix transcriptional regulator n=1 Tax=Pseudonocardia sp. TaxID=60912 RepID=UPI002F4230F2